MKHHEDDLQKAMVQYFRYTHPNDIIFAVPNGGARAARTGAILKATGVLSGVSDLIVVMKGKVLFIEVKTPTGKQQETQKIFQKMIEMQGLPYHLVRSLDEFIDLISKT